MYAFLRIFHTNNNYALYGMDTKRRKVSFLRSKTSALGTTRKQCKSGRGGTALPCGTHVAVAESRRTVPFR